MDKSLQLFIEQLQGIRWGGITAGLVDTIRIPYQGQKVPLIQLSCTMSKNGQILVTPYDTSILGVIVEALKLAGFNAYVFSKTAAVVSCTKDSIEQREKTITQIRKLAEEAKVAIRNIRRKYRNKDNDKEIQLITNEYIDKIDLVMNQKIGKILTC